MLISSYARKKNKRKRREGKYNQGGAIAEEQRMLRVKKVLAGHLADWLTGWLAGENALHCSLSCLQLYSLFFPLLSLLFFFFSFKGDYDFINSSVIFCRRQVAPHAYSTFCGAHRSR